MPSTVTFNTYVRLSYITKQKTINNSKIIIMRTLNSNQLTATLKTTKSNNWNSKRRFR